MAFEDEARTGAVVETGRPRFAPAELLRLIVDHQTDGILVRDAGGRLLYANDAAARATGYANAEALLGAPRGEANARYDIWDEGGAALAAADLPTERVLATHRPSEATVRFCRRGAPDDERWALVRATPIDDEHGHLRFIVSVLHDQTERKRREDEIAFRAEASARLAAAGSAAESIEDALARLAELAVTEPFSAGGRGLASGAFIYLTDARGQLTLAARATDTPALEPPETAAVHAAPDGGIVEAAGASVVVAPLRARDRDVGLLVLVRQPSRRPFGPGDLALVRSVASRAALAVDNARLALEAGHAVRAREDFLAVASHDLKSPLAAILFSASAILRETVDGRVRRAADAIVQAAQGMERLVHDLVDLGAIEGGRLSLALRAHDARDLVKSALSLLDPLGSRRSVSLRLDGESRLNVSCDRERVLQVLINLVGNAIEFSPAGAEVTVTIGAADGSAVFGVVDRGPGIAAEALPHVFDRYWQVEGRGPGAVGLGLSIVKALVTAHGGRIWVESEPARGSAFFFSLPLAA